MLETLVAIALSSLALISIIRLDFRSKYNENKLRTIFKKSLRESPLVNGTCSEKDSYDGIRIIGCKNKDRTQNYIRGFSSLEALLSLLLISPLFVTLSLIVSHSNKAAIQAKKEKENTYKTARISQVLDKLTDEIDNHNFDIRPRIFKKGNLPLKLSTALRPDPASDAFTYFSAKPKDSLEILTYNENSKELYACSRFASESNYQLIRSFLVLDRDDFHEGAVVKIKEASRSPKNCINLTLTFPKSLLFNTPCCPNLNLSRHLIPLESIYAIYVDRKNTLRYLGLYNGKVIENQPVLDKAPTLKFALTKLTSGIFSINTILNFKGELLEINSFNKLSRGYLSNFTLNYP